MAGHSPTVQRGSDTSGKKDNVRFYNKASDAIDHPWQVLHQLLIDSTHIFAMATGHPAKVIHVTPAMEAALTISFARRYGKHGNLREIAAKGLLGMSPIWDATVFRLE